MIVTTFLLWSLASTVKELEEENIELKARLNSPPVPPPFQNIFSPEVLAEKSLAPSGCMTPMLSDEQSYQSIQKEALWDILDEQYTSGLNQNSSSQKDSSKPDIYTITTPHYQVRRSER